MEVFRPASVEEAVATLSAHPDALVLAGGTDVMVDVNARRLHPRAVVTLRHVDELRAWEDGSIGACVTYSRLERGPITALAQAARTVGSRQIRNVGTIGGNLGTASPAGDTLPFLAAVDAEIELASSSGRRLLRWDDFILGVKQTALTAGELIARVVLPNGLPERQAFAKIGVRNAMVISLVSACVLRRPDGVTTVALGAVGPRPVRPRLAEEMISAERAPSPAAIAEFVRLVADEVTPITDHRGTERYRHHAAGVLAGRLLERVL